MRLHTLSALSFSFLFFTCKTDKKATPVNEPIAQVQHLNKTIDNHAHGYTITPVAHATAVIEYGGKSIYIDPVGGVDDFKDFKKADAVFITHAHGDHLSAETIAAIKKNNTILVVPQTVADKLPETLKKHIKVLKNGEKEIIVNIPVEAIAMYNIREEALKFHPKGAGNGYVFLLGHEKIYFSGDTEDTPEMRALKHIDKAFVCMNMPFTMTVEKAAEAVLAFQPKEVLPYHYRGKGGLSDVAKFKSLVETSNKNIKVTQWNWYPEEDK